MDSEKALEEIRPQVLIKREKQNLFFCQRQLTRQMGMVWKKKLHARQSIIFSRQLATTITLRYDKTRRIVLLTRYKKHDSSKTMTFFLSVVRFPLSRTFLFSVVHFFSRSYISPLGRTFLLSVVLFSSQSYLVVLFSSQPYFLTGQKSTTSTDSKNVRLPYRAKKYDLHTEH